MVKEVGSAIAEENHEEEGFPFVVVVFGRVEKKLDMVGDVIIENRMARWRWGRSWGSGREEWGELGVGRAGGAMEEEGIVTGERR